MKNILFFGFVADNLAIKDAFNTEANPQVSAINFQMGLLDGFDRNHVNVRILSALPISTYPTSPILLVQSKHFELTNETVKGRLMFSLNLPIIKLIIRLFTSVLYGIVEIRSMVKLDCIIVYSLHSPYLIAAIILKKLFRVPVGVFIPDLPLNMAGKNETGVRKAAKMLDNWLIHKLVALLDIAYPITEAIPKVWLPNGLKYLVVEGIAPTFNGKELANTQSIVFTKVNKPSKRVLYTGSFTYIKKFVQWFSVCQSLNVDLVLVGGGAETSELKAIAHKDSRITIKEFMLGEQLNSEIEAADFLINPRDTEWAGASFSFPSKLFDYMGRGKPIISTRMAGIPEEYFDCFIGISDDSLSAFKSSIETAMSISEQEIMARIRFGYSLLELSKSPKEVVKRIINAWSEC